jgi:hypothetical protein
MWACESQGRHRSVDHLSSIIFSDTVCQPGREDGYPFWYLLHERVANLSDSGCSTTYLHLFGSESKTRLDHPT